MKALIILAILATVGLIFLKYSRDKDIKKLLLSLGTFAIIISLAVVGNLTRPVIPIYIAHMILVIGAWAGLITYVFKNKYYWWLILSPVVTIILFLLLEFLEGSRHGILG
ncbi:MAG TPA: hypothetical protein ENK39_07370 [Epsilonproteobacteria bacterium]|nr:hypothetical protein [Campylobacterota bacterium]